MESITTGIISQWFRKKVRKKPSVLTCTYREPESKPVACSLQHRDNPLLSNVDGISSSVNRWTRMDPISWFVNIEKCHGLFFNGHSVKHEIIHCETLWQALWVALQCMTVRGTSNNLGSINRLPVRTLTSHSQLAFLLTAATDTYRSFQHCRSVPIDTSRRVSDIILFLYLVAIWVRNLQWIVQVLVKCSCNHFDFTTCHSQYWK